MLGWRSDEVLGLTANDVFEENVLAGIEAARDATLAKGEWSGELRMHHRNRQPLILESRQTLIRDERGQPKARLSINSDITDRKRFEEQFLRAQRMENIGMLAAGIAHDLNNMLAPILLATPILREHVSDAGALGLLAILEKSAERGANLVRQILAFAHGATGEHRLLQVKHLLRDISSVIAGTFPKSIRLEDYIPSDLWPIKGNPTQIHQVLLNLCVNARDAMPDGGILKLRAENRVLDLNAAAEWNGRGPAHFSCYGGRYGNGNSARGRGSDVGALFHHERKRQGTGLGLSTVRGIIEAHNGFIECVTAADRGSTFRVFLPAAEGSTAERSSLPSQPLPPGNGELILVVDDERHIREMTHTILTRNGYRVILAADGAEAAMVFGHRASEIRLVITDLQMPNLDGATLGRALRQINPGTKVLAMSGMSSSPGNQGEFKPEEFADSFLHKPFKPETLLAKVYQLLNNVQAEEAVLRGRRRARATWAGGAEMGVRWRTLVR